VIVVGYSSVTMGQRASQGDAAPGMERAELDPADVRRKLDRYLVENSEL
jgi:hypothetical protein